MPSIEHNGLVDMFRENPELAATVARLRERLSGASPVIVIIDWDPAREAPTALIAELGDADAWLDGVILLAPLSEQTASRDRHLPRRVRVMHKPVRIQRLLARLDEAQIGDGPASMRPQPQVRFAHRVLLVEGKRSVHECAQSRFKFVARHE